jgi:hypothetical protein
MHSSKQGLLYTILALLISQGLSFTIRSNSFPSSLKMSFSPCELNGDPRTLPGDPSLHLVTNIDLGDKKMEFMKACSKAVQASTGKPESYIGT